MTQLTYAKTGGPPDNWKNLQVIDASGNALPNIVEVNIAEDWAIVLDLTAKPVWISPEKKVAAKKKIKGKFRIFDTSTVDFQKLQGCTTWKINLTNKTKAHEAHLGTHALECPWANPSWSQWVFGLFHLRDIKDVPPVDIVFEGATHQVIVGAINPKFPLKPWSSPDEPLHYLTPMDQSCQFAAETDAEALVRLEAAILAICHRNLSPDATFRDSFNAFFQTKIDVNPVN